MNDDREARLHMTRTVRERLRQAGPSRSRPFAGDFERVALPASDCDVLRDVLIGENARVVIEVGLAYGSSALAIGEALLSGTHPKIQALLIDPFQATSFANAGWDAMCDAGLQSHSLLVDEPSSLALARWSAEGVLADAAFVDGSHRFHEVFVDLYYLRKLVRPAGLIILDDCAFPSVATALRYFDLNLGWERVEVPGRLEARRLPAERVEPDFTDFKSFGEQGSVG